MVQYKICGQREPIQQIVKCPHTREELFVFELDAMVID